MLLELSIKNFAIIEELNVNFLDGLNIITGETGTGKSILIEALGVLLGSRSNKDYIRTGETEAFLEAVFYLKNDKNTLALLKEYNIDISDDKILIINKVISNNGPTISKINGKTVTLNMLNNISKNIVDIFGQHENQTLLDIQNHKKIIDSFGDKEFYLLKSEIKELYAEYEDLIRKLDSISIDSSAKDREIDILNFQIDEIENANINPADENIEDLFKKYKNTENIQKILGDLVNSLEYSDINATSVLDSINRNLSSLKTIATVDEEIANLVKRLESINYELEDINRSSKYYIESLDIDYNEILEIEDRMNLIINLKNKYGKTIEEIEGFKLAAEARLENLLNQDMEIEKINIKIKDLKETIYNKSLELSKRRRDISLFLEDLLSQELEMLNMQNVIFKVKFEETEISLDGIDRLEFLISTNLGEDLKPLNKIASGGEMSRIMLAFKNILSDYDNTSTLIFDEIDTGISGRTAQIVGEKIYEISKNHQIICISHLPQITALADNHYLIQKETSHNKTGSYITKLSKEEQVNELARLIGGADITETTKKHALEMLELANDVKITY